MDANLRWTTVCIDGRDAESLADFYCRLLGWQITARDGHGWVQAWDPNGGVGLNFQSEAWYRPPTWPEEPHEQAKMLHFEILVDDLEAAVGTRSRPAQLLLRTSRRIETGAVCA